MCGVRAGGWVALEEVLWLPEARKKPAAVDSRSDTLGGASLRVRRGKEGCGLVGMCRRRQSRLVPGAPPCPTQSLASLALFHDRRRG